MMIGLPHGTGDLPFSPNRLPRRTHRPSWEPTIGFQTKLVAHKPTQPCRPRLARTSGLEFIMRRLRIAGGALTLLFLHASGAFGDPITFTHQGFGTASIGGHRSVDVAFTITAAGDTVNRQSLESGFFIEHTSASISIAGVGAFTFLTPTRTFVNNGFQVVGFSRAGVPGGDLFFGPNSDFLSTWDMRSSIGPVAGTGALLQWRAGILWGTDILTTGGRLDFEDTESLAIFSATTGAATVPEPSTLTLLGLGLGATSIARLLRRRTARGTQ